MKGKNIPEKIVEQKIFVIRGQKVMLDKDLAELYQVPTKRINEQVKRNLARFPKDFMFQLTKIETKELVANCDRFANLKHATVTPYAFTEHGVAMLSSVLNSDRAIQMNIAIIRAFIKMREIVATTHKELADRLDQLERKVGQHDKEIKLIFDAIRQLIQPMEEKPKPKIGFIQGKKLPTIH